MEDETTKIALIDGKKVLYHATVNIKDGSSAYNECMFDYIGKGVIYSIDGFLQNSQALRYFWKRSSSHPLWV